jgi:hypothetical protein
MKQFRHCKYPDESRIIIAAPYINLPWIVMQERPYREILANKKKMQWDNTGLEIDYLDVDASPHNMET